MRHESEELLELWFGEPTLPLEELAARVPLWFASDAEFDREISERFWSLPERALTGELDDWATEPRSALALVLALDQLPRNLYRGQARAFEFDARACEVAERAIDAGFDQRLSPVHTAFFYVPFEHAEDLGLQDRGVALFEQLVARAPEALVAACTNFASYARRHRDVVRRFGRFPHRNVLLGRSSTRAEIDYLESGGERFGG